MANLKKIRWKQRFRNFESSYLLLEKYSDQWIYSELERAGLIQIFETTFELAWKTLRDYLESEGYDAVSPRASIKKAYQIGLLEDGEGWLEALDSRNITSHTYSDERAEQVIELIKEKYAPLIEKLYDALKEILENGDDA